MKPKKCMTIVTSSHRISRLIANRVTNELDINDIGSCLVVSYPVPGGLGYYPYFQATLQL